ncbi:MlaA family lipoprotein [Entomobacter blattae]|uniref:Putative phospholipid-binding lipoprotein MlaA n=1 Tax=Entomobacter blattae TaxID=2762277 RepID=A0A7H1NR05_9PROT|nr:VacJ family lipoprotein [Entomobacter blattae]QNT78215.1 putative phospholipid-binding lipoprotein MlaA [Entomobacter blattae]
MSVKVYFKSFFKPFAELSLSRSVTPLFLVAVLATLATSACSTAPKPTDPEALAEYNATNDPYEPTNRDLYDITHFVDKNAFAPVARAYVWAIPEEIRNALGNLVTTWNEPVVFFSDVGNGKPRLAGDTFMRWVINMTVGLAGFIDVAGDVADIHHHDDDPGVVLASWGVPSGPYLFVPFLGPNTYRTLGGYVLGIGVQPLNYAPRGYGLLTFNWAYNIMGAINTRANYIDAIDQLEKDALDPYATIRSAWMQQRKALIKKIQDDHRATTPDWY